MQTNYLRYGVKVNHLPHLFLNPSSHKTKQKNTACSVTLVFCVWGIPIGHGSRRGDSRKNGTKFKDGMFANSRGTKTVQFLTNLPYTRYVATLSRVWGESFSMLNFMAGFTHILTLCSLHTGRRSNST